MHEHEHEHEHAMAVCTVSVQDRYPAQQSIKSFFPILYPSVIITPGAAAAVETLENGSLDVVSFRVRAEEDVVESDEEGMLDDDDGAVVVTEASEEHEEVHTVSSPVHHQPSSPFKKSTKHQFVTPLRRFPLAPTSSPALSLASVGSKRHRNEDEDDDDEERVGYPNKTPERIRSTLRTRFKVPAFLSSSPSFSDYASTPLRHAPSLASTTATFLSSKSATAAPSNSAAASKDLVVRHAGSRPKRSINIGINIMQSDQDTEKKRQGSLAVQLSAAERRLRTVTLALKYRQEEQGSTIRSCTDDEDEEDEDMDLDGSDGLGERAGRRAKGKLERLGIMWGEIGKTVAVALWEHSALFAPATSSSIYQLDSNANPFGSFGFGAPSSFAFDAQSGFGANGYEQFGFDALASQQQQCQEESQDESKGDDNDDDDDDDDDEDEEMGTRNEVEIEQVSEHEEKEGDVAMADGVEEEEETEKAREEWNIASLLRSIGIDPTLFGWDEESGDFSASDDALA